MSRPQKKGTACLTFASVPTCTLIDAPIRRGRLASRSEVERGAERVGTHVPSVRAILEVERAVAQPKPDPDPPDQPEFGPVPGVGRDKLGTGAVPVQVFALFRMPGLEPRRS